jgi:hypothetical protein
VAHRQPHKRKRKRRQRHRSGKNHAALGRVDQLLAGKIGAHLRVGVVALDAEQVCLRRVVDAVCAVHHAHPLCNGLPLLVLEHPEADERLGQRNNLLELVLQRPRILH